MPLDRKPAPNDLRAFWMPFTANRQFKQAPRMLVSAQDMHYTAADGRKVLDGTAGLWCCNAGHCRPRITQAVSGMVGTLDYAPAFQMGHPGAFELANRIIDIAPEGLLLAFGLLDDVMVIGWVAATLVKETEEFIAWEQGVAAHQAQWAQQQDWSQQQAWSSTVRSHVVPD